MYTGTLKIYDKTRNRTSGTPATLVRNSTTDYIHGLYIAPTTAHIMQSFKHDHCQCLHYNM